jgi:hypothetical protein
MTRLSDAAAINAAAGPHWESIQPEWDEKAERGECADEDYGDGDLGAVNLGAVTAVFLLSLLGAVLFLLAVSAGRHGMCRLYADQPAAPSYCTAATR